MLNEESRRKIRELKLDELVDILDDQEHRLDVYASMSFDDRLSLTIDELYYQKNSKRSKRLISSAKLRYPDADINTLILEPRGLSKPRMIALAAESYLMDDYSGPPAHPGRSSAQPDRASAHLIRSAVQPMLAAGQHTC